MKRRDLLRDTMLSGLLMAASPASARSQRTKDPGAAAQPLRPPAQGPVPVAFLLSDGAVVIDFAGPWEVFQDVMLPGRSHGEAFRLYTVSESTNPIRASGGLTLVPDYTLQTAPPPKVIVIPAQGDPSEAVLAWVRTAAGTADLTLSICTGAFLLARTGLLSGKPATTHHGAYTELAMAYPEVTVKRGARFVDTGSVATSGGLSSGIDLALHVVERYYGREVASATAYQMEYQGTGWLRPDSNQAYARRRASTAAHPLCPVCEMEVDPATAESSVYRGRTFHFCSPAHKQRFDATPGAFADPPLR